MPKKSGPVLCNDLQYRYGQDFSEIQYMFSLESGGSTTTAGPAEESLFKQRQVSSAGTYALFVPWYFYQVVA